MFCNKVCNECNVAITYKFKMHSGAQKEKLTVSTLYDPINTGNDFSRCKNKNTGNGQISVM